MTAAATLSSKFQISIPKTVREEQHWEAGQEFVFHSKGKGVPVMPVPELEQLARIAKGAKKDGYRDRERDLETIWTEMPKAEASEHGLVRPAGIEKIAGRPVG